MRMKGQYLDSVYQETGSSPRAGYLVTVAGKGSFVAPRNLELMREAHLAEVESHLRQAAQMARGCGLTWQELEEMLELQWEEEP